MTNHRQDISFMPPEVLDGKLCDNSTDFHILGIMLYQMLVGEVPYYVKQDNQKMYQ